MSFVTEFIKGLMEDPEDRDNKERQRVKTMHERSLRLKEQWDEANKMEGFWRSKERTRLFDIDMQVAGKDGKQTKYMATPTQRANSYETLLEIYNQKATNSNS